MLTHCFGSLVVLGERMSALTSTKAEELRAWYNCIKVREEENRVDAVVSHSRQPAPPALLKTPEGAESSSHPCYIPAGVSWPVGGLKASMSMAAATTGTMCLQDIHRKLGRMCRNVDLKHVRRTLQGSPAVFWEGCGQLSRDQSFGQAPHEGQNHKADQRQERPRRRHRVLRAAPQASSFPCPDHCLMAGYPGADPKGARERGSSVPTWPCQCHCMLRPTGGALGTAHNCWSSTTKVTKRCMKVLAENT